MPKLYVATCPACGSSAAGAEQPDHCPYCPPPAPAAGRSEGTSWRRWILIWAGLGVVAGLLGGGR